MQAELNSFLDALSASRTESEAGTLLLSLFQSKGADGGNIWFAVGNGQNSTVNSQVSSYPLSLLDYMYNEVDGSALKVAQRVSQQLNPIRWGWEHDQHRYPKNSLDYEYSAVSNSETGMMNGLIIPIPSPGKTGSSGVSFYSKLSSDKFNKLVEKEGLGLSVAAYAAHAKIQTLRWSRPIAISLSNREKECLLWLARGLRTKEISHKLNIREVTVSLHITNARKKLSASTRDQAVAIAIVNSLIAP